jgi:hypothetical protein
LRVGGERAGEFRAFEDFRKTHAEAASGSEQSDECGDMHHVFVQARFRSGDGAGEDEQESETGGDESGWGFDAFLKGVADDAEKNEEGTEDECETSHDGCLGGGLSVAADGEMNVFEDERFFVKRRRSVGAVVFPSGNVGEPIVVAFCFTGLSLARLDVGIGFGELVLRTEMAAAGFFAIAGIVAHEFAKFEEIGDATGFFQLHVRVVTGTGNADVCPEFLTDLRDFFDRFRQSFASAFHAAVVPHQHAELAVEGVDRASSLDREELVDAFGRFFGGGFEFRGFSGDAARFLRCEVVGDGGGNDEVAIGQPLHQGGGSQAVGTVIGEIRFAQNVEAGNVRHQVIVHPKPAHGVVDGRINHHRQLIRIFAGDFFIHLEKVAVAGADRVFAETCGCVAEVEINSQTGGGDAAAVIAGFFRSAGRNVARRKVAEGWIFPFEEVVALVFRDVFGGDFLALEFFGDLLRFRGPDAAVVAERLRHQGELRLVIAADRDAGRVNLGEARIGEKRAATGGTPGGGHVAAHRIGRQEKDVAVAAGCEDHRIGRVGADHTGSQIADDDAFGVAVDQDEVEHFGAGVHFHAAFMDFLFERLVAADEQLLTGLAPSVKGAGNLSTAERPVVEQTAVFPGERNTLGDALVDDLVGNFRQAVNVRFTRTEVAAFDRVVEKPADRVAVVAVIFRGVDSPLCGDRVSAARTVEVREAFHLIAKFGERRGSRSTCEARADDDDGEFPFVRRVDELRVHLVLRPLLLKRAGRDFAIKYKGHGEIQVEMERGSVAVAEDQNRNGNGDETEPDDRGVAPGEAFDERAGFFRIEAEGLENGGDAVAEVGTENGHRDDVKNRDIPDAEAVDHHFPGVVAGLTGFGEIGGIDVGFVGVSRVNGVMHQVVDDKKEDREAGPNHDARGFGRLDGVVVFVGLAGGAVLAGQRDGCGDVKEERGEQAKARNPDARSMQRVVEKLRVVVERFTACEKQQVSRHVTGEEKDENDAGDRNDEFFSNRRRPIGGSSASESVHEVLDRGIGFPQGGLSLRLVLFKGNRSP